MINCLEYALDFWNENKDYKIQYNSNHCINVPIGTKIYGFDSIEGFGFDYFESWFTEQNLISKRTYKLLIDYFRTYCPALPIIDVTIENKKPLIVGRSEIKGEPYQIYCDGSCAVHSTQQGRWAYVVIDSKEGVVHQDGMTFQNTTNSEMEVNGLYHSLKYSVDNLEDSPVTIYCDSSYVVKGYNEWCEGWKKKGWKKANNTPVAFGNVWKEIDKLRSENITVEWIKGHSDSKWNNYVDELTRQY